MHRVEENVIRLLSTSQNRLSTSFTSVSHGRGGGGRGGPGVTGTLRFQLCCLSVLSPVDPVTQWSTYCRLGVV